MPATAAQAARPSAPTPVAAPWLEKGGVLWSFHQAKCEFHERNQGITKENHGT